MKFNLPLTDIQEKEFTSILNHWEFLRRIAIDSAKKVVIHQLRKRWWNEIFHRGTPDDALFEINYPDCITPNLFEAMLYKKNEIKELAGVIASHRVAKAMHSSSQITLSTSLTEAISKEVNNG